jgi:hypothetical protein
MPRAVPKLLDTALGLLQAWPTHTSSPSTFGDRVHPLFHQVGCVGHQLLKSHAW